MNSVAVIGAGAWGTALAVQAARAGAEVTLWARDPARAAAIERTRENPAAARKFRLPGTVHVTADLPDRRRWFCWPCPFSTCGPWQPA